MRLRQVEELLDARAQADAEPLAAPERDQRMRKLVALAERIGPRIEERGEPLQPVRRGDEDRGRARSAGAASSPRKSRQSRPPRNRMPKAIATMTTNAPKSGSSSSSAAGGDHHREQRQEAADQRLLQRLLRVQERGLAHRVARGVQHDGELHELGGLQVDDDERQPAAAAVDGAADAGNEHQHEQQRGASEQPRRELLPCLHRDLERDERGSEAGRDEDRRAAAGSTTRESRCTTTPRPSRSTPNRPSRAPPRAAAASPMRAKRRRRASSAGCAAARRAPRRPCGAPDGRSIAVDVIALRMRALRRHARGRGSRSARRARRSWRTGRGSRTRATAAPRRRACASGDGARDGRIERPAAFDGARAFRPARARAPARRGRSAAPRGSAHRRRRVSAAKSWPLPSPPAISTTGRSMPSSAACVAATVVPFESST